MKKLVALAGVVSLAACGGGETETADTAEVAGEEVAAVPDSAGTYTGTDLEGRETTWVLNEDGTYEIMADGEMVESGAWIDTVRGTCLTAEGAEEEQCYNFVAGEGDTFEVTGPEGETITMTRES